MIETMEFYLEKTDKYLMMPVNLKKNKYNQVHRHAHADRHTLSPSIKRTIKQSTVAI